MVSDSVDLGLVFVFIVLKAPPQACPRWGSHTINCPIISAYRVADCPVVSFVTPFTYFGAADAGPISIMFEVFG